MTHDELAKVYQYLINGDPSRRDPERNGMARLTRNVYRSSYDDMSPVIKGVLHRLADHDGWFHLPPFAHDALQKSILLEKGTIVRYTGQDCYDIDQWSGALNKYVPVLEYGLTFEHRGKSYITLAKHGVGCIYHPQTLFDAV